MERIGANTEATKQNATHQRMMAGCDALGYEHRPLWRNASLDDEPANCGYCSFGCQHGCKRSAMKTCLQDASDAGARVLVGCHADRVLVDGRAGDRRRGDGDPPRRLHHRGHGRGPDGRRRRRLGRVAGPAPAQRHRRAGRRQEPAPAPRLRSSSASTRSRSTAGSGQIQSALSDHFSDVEDDCGFLIEAVGVAPGLIGAALPWETAPRTSA